MRMPSRRMASSCAPRAMKWTSCPARASSPPKNAPTPPAPKTTVRTACLVPLGGGLLAPRCRLRRWRRRVFDPHVADQRHGASRGRKGVHIVQADDREPFAEDAGALVLFGDHDLDWLDT